MSSHSPIDTAHAMALDRWNRPFPGFASGHDRRTSDQGLLTVLYGGLEHAARYEWLNAGRRLIDRTYIDMLWHVQGLTDLGGVRADRIAAALDLFITDVVKPVWNDLPHLRDQARLETSIGWVEQMAGQCFGSIYSETAASRLMFYLCPMLPVFNLSQGNLMALDKDRHRPHVQGYRAFAQAAATAYRVQLPGLMHLTPPTPTVLDAQQRVLLEGVLTQTDWWTRRVFDEYLRELVGCDKTVDADRLGREDPGLFGKDPY